MRNPNIKFFLALAEYINQLRRNESLENVIDEVILSTAIEVEAAGQRNSQPWVACQGHMVFTMDDIKCGSAGFDLMHKLDEVRERIIRELEAADRGG